jgi:hypothetical protein
MVVIVRASDLAGAVTFEILTRESTMRMVLDLIVGA